MPPTEEAEVVDATPVEAEENAAAPAAPQEVNVTNVSNALVPAAHQGDVMRPLDGDALVASFEEYQALRGKLLNGDDYQSAGGGKNFVKKSGWRKIATAFGLNLQIIRSDVDRDDSGDPSRAEVWARAIAPNGRFADGDGYCSINEDRFSGSRGNKSKLENDLRATATTRATNRAISNLVGMGEVSAEEADGRTKGPEFGPTTDAKGEAQLVGALAFLFGNDAETARAAYMAIGTELGYIPHAVVRSLDIAARTLIKSNTEEKKDAPDANAGPADADAGEQPGV